jgi:hypothetical protein
MMDVKPSEPSWLKTRRPAKSRQFIAEFPLRSAVVEGVNGVLIRARLTSYRSLPLSCIESIEISVNGAAADPGTMRLILNGRTHRLQDLARLSDVWWFILDYADLFVPLRAPLEGGIHEVKGDLVTVEPYMTAGRFSFHHAAQARLQWVPGSGEAASDY